MTRIFISKGAFPTEYLQPVVDHILENQRKDGLVPWFKSGHADPWDHIEAAMGLSIAGEYNAAKHAYLWLKDNQLADGSWWSKYLLEPESEDEVRKETNFSAYIATGIWHHYLISGDYLFLHSMWATVQRAIDFVLQYQSEHGEISWATNADNSPRDDALVTGCSSIYKSLECAIQIADTLNKPHAHWFDAREKLGNALRHHPERFDRTWESKARYSMDWFYPVLSGAVQGSAAHKRINDRWDEFVVDGIGCRCVSDEPWVTVAESCELVMSLLNIGEYKKAATLFSWLHDQRDENGVYWTGYVYPDKSFWPEEKPTWTGGAILMAADALTEHTDACRLFTEDSLATTKTETETETIEQAD